MRIFLFIFLLITILSSGCVPVTNDNGWSWFGYTKTTDNSRLEVGGISTRLGVENGSKDNPNPFFEEDLKESGVVVGIFYEKRF